MMKTMMLGLAATIAAPASAETGGRVLVSGVEPSNHPGSLLVEITILNPGSGAGDDSVPDRISGELRIADRRTPVTLERTPHSSGARAIPPGGFAQAHYLLRLPADGAPRQTAILSLTTTGYASGYAFSLPDNPAILSRQQSADEPGPTVPAMSPPAAAPAPSAKPDSGNAFLGNLSSYAPIYAVYGPGTNSDGRLQISFKYQLFGDAGLVGGNNPLINGIHFAYTQRLFWNLDAHSSPFRNIDYMPEVFYLVPATRITDRIALGGQAGLRHESNGRDGLESRSVNTVYIQPIATMPVGKYTLSVGPRLWFYAGNLKDNPDIKRYRGNSGLFVEIGQDDGLRLTTNSRFNFASGKGAIDAELSYPFDRIIESDLNLYVFGQGFAGYGENLLDYNRKTTRLRVGIGIVR